MSKHRTVILKRDTRALARSAFPFTNTLSNVGIIWFRKGDRLELGETLKMNYDHDTKTVVQLIRYIPDYFIIESELEVEDPELEQHTTVE